MPKNPEIKKVLVLGSGPIVIGQAAEFDYAGTQACRSLKEEGIEVVLLNSNPATIMTDKDIADHVYIEPLNLASVEQVIAKERPDSILPTLGGQTGLNLAMNLHEQGILEKYNVRLLGTSPESIRKAEDRQGFKDAMEEIGQPCVVSDVVESVEDAAAFAASITSGAMSRPLGQEVDGQALPVLAVHIAVEQPCVLIPLGALSVQLQVFGKGPDRLFPLKAVGDQPAHQLRGLQRHIDGHQRAPAGPDDIDLSILLFPQEGEDLLRLIKPEVAGEGGKPVGPAVAQEIDQNHAALTLVPLCNLIEHIGRGGVSVEQQQGRAGAGLLVINASVFKLKIAHDLTPYIAAVRRTVFFRRQTSLTWEKPAERSRRIWFATVQGVSKWYSRASSRPCCRLIRRYAAKSSSSTAWGSGHSWAEII